MIGSPVAVPGATIDPPARGRVGTLGLLLDARRAYRGGPAAVAARQRARLAALVDHARTRSPFYRRLYAGLPERVEDPRLWSHRQGDRCRIRAGSGREHPEAARQGKDTESTGTRSRVTAGRLAQRRLRCFSCARLASCRGCARGGSAGRRRLHSMRARTTRAAPGAWSRPGT